MDDRDLFDFDVYLDDTLDCSTVAATLALGFWTIFNGNDILVKFLIMLFFVLVELNY